MIDKVKIILGFFLFLYLLKLINERYFTVIEGMCMDGENELPGITETECSNGGFTWNPPPDVVDQILQESQQAETSETSETSELSKNITPQSSETIIRPPKVETDEERDKRIKREADKSSHTRNLITGSILSSSCCSYCCSCLFCLSMFLPLLKR